MKTVGRVRPTDRHRLEIAVWSLLCRSDIAALHCLAAPRLTERHRTFPLNISHRTSISPKTRAAGEWEHNGPLAGHHDAQPCIEPEE